MQNENLETLNVLQDCQPGHDFWSCIQCWPHGCPYPKHPMEFGEGLSVPVHEGCQLIQYAATKHLTEKGKHFYMHGPEEN